MITKTLNVGEIPYQVFQYAVVAACRFSAEDREDESLKKLESRIDISSKDRVEWFVWEEESDFLLQVVFRFTGSKVLIIGYYAANNLDWWLESSAQWVSHFFRNQSAVLRFQYYPFAFNPVTCTNQHDGRIETVRLLPDYTILKEGGAYCYNRSTSLYKCTPEGEDGTGRLYIQQIDAYGLGKRLCVAEHGIFYFDQPKEALIPLVTLFEYNRNIINLPILLKDQDDQEKTLWACLALNGFILGDELIEASSKIYANHFGFHEEELGCSFEYSSGENKYSFQIDFEANSIKYLRIEGSSQVEINYSVERISDTKALQEEGGDGQVNAFVDLMAKLSPRDYAKGTEFSPLITDLTERVIKERKKERKEEAEFKSDNPYLYWPVKILSGLWAILSRILSGLWALVSN